MAPTHRGHELGQRHTRGHPGCHLHQGSPRPPHTGRPRALETLPPRGLSPTPRPPLSPSSYHNSPHSEDAARTCGGSSCRRRRRRGLPTPLPAPTHTRAPAPKSAAPPHARAPRPPGPALTSHRPQEGSGGMSPVGEGPRPCAGEGRGAAVEGAARPGSRRPARWGRRRGPGRPGQPSGDGRGNGSLRRRSRRCRRCPGPAAVARRPLLPWPPLSRAPSPGDSAIETREGDEGTPKTNRASHHPPEQDPPSKPRRERGAAAPPSRGGALDANAPQRSGDLSWARESTAFAQTFSDPGPQGPKDSYVPCSTSSMPFTHSTST